MMKKFLLSIILFCSFHAVFAFGDTIIIPIRRQLLHDKITNEQNRIDAQDGKKDANMHAVANEDINLQLTDVLFRKVNDLKNGIELNNNIVSNNEKVRYLSYIEDMLRNFRLDWKQHKINPLLFPVLVEDFGEAMKLQSEGASVVNIVQEAPYEIAKIITQVLVDNKDRKELHNIVYLKFVHKNPDKILETIRPFAEESFADSLIILAAQINPVQLYSFAQSKYSTEGKLIHRNENSLVKAVSELSQTPNALFYFPFLDDILSGKKTITGIQKFVGDGHKGYDSVGYFKLLVQTEIDYFKRMSSPAKDTPIAMFGANSMHEVLKAKAIQHFITPINALHDLSNIDARMRAIDPLSPVELYYVLIMGESDIYTSSYKHAFARFIARMGPQPRTDSLLMKVHFDSFKKFIKMAANFNQLDLFLSLMPPPNAEILMKAFVANLDKGNSLEDAVDVADSYSSINNPLLLKAILGYVEQNEEQSITANNSRGSLVYGLLKTIFLSADSNNHIDLTSEIGIPSIYEITNKSLQDDKGRIVQQVFFYGDEDGKTFFPGFVNSFSSRDWTTTVKEEWVEIKSKKSEVYVFANRPLDYNENLDDSAQVHLGNYLAAMDMQPSMVVHRGHSYWLKGTIDRMSQNAKIVLLGSCGGYQNLNEILEVAPDAHIISTKEIGAGDINGPIINYLSTKFVDKDTIVWKNMWTSLGKFFSNDPSKMIRESWEDYIPPYRNLGAIFLKGYHLKTADTVD